MATKGDRKDLKQRVDHFKTKQADLAPLQDKPPSNLDKYAAQLWRFIVPELKKYGQISSIDRPNLEVLCSAYSTYRLAQEAIEEYGPWVIDEAGYPVKRSPALAQLSDAVKIIKSLSAGLGLSFNVLRQSSNPPFTDKKSFRENGSL